MLIPVIVRSSEAFKAWDAARSAYNEIKERRIRAEAKLKKIFDAEAAALWVEAEAWKAIKVERIMRHLLENKEYSKALDLAELNDYLAGETK